MPVDTVEFLIEQRFFKPGAMILDIGCGNGRFAKTMKPYNFHYFGIDIQRANLWTAMRDFREHENFKFYHADIYNFFYNPWGKIKAVDFTFPFKDESFDNIICHSLFTHLGDLENAQHYMNEIYRMLKVDGKLWITWFRSPPNTVNNGEARTVYEEDDIKTMLAGFKIEHEQEGETTDKHDQWKIIARKM